MSQNVAQLATHEQRFKDLGGVFFWLLGRVSEGIPVRFFCQWKIFRHGSHVIQNGD
jgi:hypothetical protein